MSQKSDVTEAEGSRIREKMPALKIEEGAMSQGMQGTQLKMLEKIGNRFSPKLPQGVQPSNTYGLLGVFPVISGRRRRTHLGLVSRWFCMTGCASCLKVNPSPQSVVRAMEFSGLPVFPMTLKQLAGQNGGMAF